MKNKRVGTISMAIILIAMGVLMFISQINEVSAIDMAFKLWPLTLVLLGIEILWAKYKSSDEETIIKYDVFSVFIVFIILMVNIGMYGITETGIMKVIKSRISEQSYNYELPNEEFIIDESVEKIIVEGFNNSRVKVRTTENNKVFATGSIVVNSDSEENAKATFDSDIFKIEKLDNIVYIKYRDSYDYRISDINLTLPSNKKVEIKGGNELDLVMDSLSNNWIVDGVSRVKLRLNKDLDMMVSTILSQENNFGGNANWTDTQLGTEEDHKHKGELVFGQGTNKLNILDAYEVIADEI